MQEFSKTNQKKDILIIGDSHSEDLVNAVFETGLNNEKEFASYYISVRCGVLYVADKSDREDPKSNCQNKPQSFFNNDLQMQMSLADEVWIISSWMQSDVLYMFKSIENIKTINKNIKLFGTKHFGSPSARWYNITDQNEWSSSVFNDGDIGMYSIIAETNEDIKSIADSLNVEFINTQHLICKGYNFCSNYVDGMLFHMMGLILQNTVLKY